MTGYNKLRHIKDWCPEPESNRYARFTEATDFKSVVSTYFTTRAKMWKNARNRASANYTEMRDWMVSKKIVLVHCKILCLFS